MTDGMFAVYLYGIFSSHVAIAKYVYVNSDIYKTKVQKPDGHIETSCP